MICRYTQGCLGQLACDPYGGDVRRVITQEGAPSLTWRSMPLDHVLSNAGLRDLKPELEQFIVDTRCSPKRVLNAHSPDQSAQPALICGRPPNGRDFQRQYRQKPARCQRTSVAGRMNVMTFRTDGNHRYSWIKNKRSLFVSRTRLCTIRRNTTTWCRSAAFPTSSRLFDLNGETKTARTKHSSAIIVR